MDDQAQRPESPSERFIDGVPRARPPEANIPTTIRLEIPLTPLSVRTIPCVVAAAACDHTHIDRPVRADAHECAVLLPSGQRLICANKQTSGVLGVPLSELARFEIGLESVQQCIEVYGVPAECIFGVLVNGDLVVPVDVLPHLHGTRAYSHALCMLYSTQLRIWGSCLSTSNHVRFSVFSELMTGQMMHMTGAISAVEASMQGAIDVVCKQLDTIYDRLSEFEQRFEQQRLDTEALTMQLVTVAQLLATSDRPHMQHLRTVVDNVRHGTTIGMNDAIVAMQHDINTLVANLSPDDTDHIVPPP